MIRNILHVCISFLFIKQIWNKKKINITLESTVTNLQWANNEDGNIHFTPFTLQSISEFNLILNDAAGLSPACLLPPRMTRCSTTYYTGAIHTALKRIKTSPACCSGSTSTHFYHSSRPAEPFHWILQEPDSWPWAHAPVRCSWSTCLKSADFNGIIYYYQCYKHRSLWVSSLQ